MASIFVWLRYSSARHLTWQRNYNTQPRILGEAQAKLTHKIAEVGHPASHYTRFDHAPELNWVSSCSPQLTAGHTSTQVTCLACQLGKLLGE